MSHRVIKYLNKEKKKTNQEVGLVQQQTRNAQESHKKTWSTNDERKEIIRKSKFLDKCFVNKIANADEIMGDHETMSKDEFTSVL